MILKIFLSVLVAFFITFTLFYLIIIPIPNTDSKENMSQFFTQNFDDKNKILLLGSSYVGEMNSTYVNKKISTDFLVRMRKGVQLKNILTKSCEIKKINNYSFKIILTQGLNRQIRKMCRHFDYKVKFLKRIRIIDISLGNLRVGQFRNFTQPELNNLLVKLN